MNSDTETTQRLLTQHIPLLRDLPAANNPPMRVTRDTQLRDAITLMMVNDYSQLPVMQGDRNIEGYISWRSIGEAFALNKECKIVRDCMRSSIIMLDDNEPLLSAVSIIAKEDFVLVRNREKRIVGIVTTSDITSCFYELAEPFFLIGQI
ncbi:MAG: CBS domain-containing protein [Thermodesulfobacteriota bacterium]